jgi:hypothetical protein
MAWRGPAQGLAKIFQFADLYHNEIGRVVEIFRAALSDLAGYQPAEIR